MGFLQPAESGPPSRIKGKASSDTVSKLEDMPEAEPEFNATTSLIKKVILDSLGKPLGFAKIEVKSVGSNVYRANVLCYTSDKGFYSGVSRPHSYYVRITDKDLVFSPSIKKLY